MSASQATAPALERGNGSKPHPSTLTYSIAIFLSAFLLFQVQLIAGKFMLPRFGGSPSVWNTCLLVFQLSPPSPARLTDLVSRRPSMA